MNDFQAAQRLAASKEKESLKKARADSDAHFFGKYKILLNNEMIIFNNYNILSLFIFYKHDCKINYRLVILFINTLPCPCSSKT